MERIWTTDLSRYAGQQVHLAGWMQRLRRLSNVAFLVLRDGKGAAQIVVEDPQLIERLAGLHTESVLVVEGRAVAALQAPGGVEVREPSVTVLSAVDATPPLDLFKPTLAAQLPTILDNAPLALRHPRQRALFRLAAASLSGFRSTLRARDFVEIQTPKIVAGATESGATVFTIDYFGTPAYLAQSPQLYKQIMIGVFERVFETGPVFRAEPHDTPRHLNEYVSLDAELGFIEDHTTVMAVLTDVIRGMVTALETEAADALTLLGVALPVVPPTIPVLHFTEAQDLILRESGEDARGEQDLAPAHERLLGAWARRQHGSDFLFITGYPTAKRAFYTYPDPLRPGYSRAFDLLYRGLELVSGSQRLHRYEDYLTVFAERGLDPAPFTAYLQAMQYGMPPHGGFAIGLERWVARLVGADNIRETTLFPRDLHRLTP